MEKIISEIDAIITRLTAKRLRHSVRKAEVIKKQVQKQKKLSSMNSIELQQLEYVCNLR